MMGMMTMDANIKTSISQLISPFLVTLLMVAPTPSTAENHYTIREGRNFGGSAPMNNEALKQAVQLWLGSDHNKAEITAMHGHISFWDTSEVTSFNSLFKGSTAFDEDLSAWNTTSVTDMSDLFNGCSSFRGKPSLESWDTSKVTSMARMFKSATSWEGDLGFLDTSSVTDMSHMFQGATFFKGDGLESWDVSKVNTFNYMFNRATNFNKDISSWNMESAEYMEGMFEYAATFNQNISAWDMANAKSIASMFEGAARFDQSVCWPGLEESAVVGFMFCDGHPGGRLDPCCVKSNDLILAGCCGGSCDTFCAPPTLSTRPPVSNDDRPQRPDATDDDDDDVEDDNEDDEDEDISFLDQDADNEDDLVGGVVEDTTTTYEEQVNATGSTGNDTDATEDLFVDTIPTVVSLEGEQSESDTNNGSDGGNLWQRELWLRIVVYVLAMILLGLIFLYILHTRTKGRRQATPVAAEGDEDKKEGEAETREEQDEEVGNIETTPTEETDAAAAAAAAPGEEVKPMEGSETNAETPEPSNK